MTARSPTRFRVLVVCTGNICRSPQAAQLLRTWVDAAGQSVSKTVEIASAGTHATPGSAMDPCAARAVTEFGISPAAHSARRLAKNLIAEADLVLCMERAHRSTVVKHAPRASRYTFLITEFGTLLEDLLKHGSAEIPRTSSPHTADENCVPWLRAAVRAAAARRGQVPPSAETRREIVDPYRAGESAYRESAAEIYRTLELIWHCWTQLTREKRR